VASLTAFISICIAMSIGVVSPGPSFVLVAKTSLSEGRAVGIGSALGMGLAGALYALLAVLGLAAALTRFPDLFTVIRFLGGAYLAYIAVGMFVHAKNPLPSSATVVTKPRSGLMQGAITQLSNPKTVVFYSSVFAALMPSQPDLWLLVALPLAMGLIETGWYVLVATFFASESAAALYEQRKTAIDRTAGAVMLLLAGKLLFFP